MPLLPKSGRGVALHVGANRLIPTKWFGQSPPTEAAFYNVVASFWENSVSGGFKADTVTNEDATRTRVKSFIKTAASKARPGDCFLLTISALGFYTSKPDPNVLTTENRAVALADGPLTFPELKTWLSDFPAGCHLFVFIDSGYDPTGPLALSDVLVGKTLSAMSATKPAPPVEIKANYAWFTGAVEKAALVTTTLPRLSHFASNILRAIQIGGKTATWMSFYTKLITLAETGQSIGFEFEGPKRLLAQLPAWQVPRIITPKVPGPAVAMATTAD